MKWSTAAGIRGHNVFDLKSLLRPSTPAEAVRALRSTEGRGLYLAGGTILVPTGSPNLDFLVDLTAVGLDYVRVDGGPDGPRLRIGAMTRIADLVRSKELPGPAGQLIREAASSVGTHTVRNRATVGGNIAASHFPSDLPPALLALGATLVLLDEKAPREVALADYYGRRAEVYRKGDLITEVWVPEGAHGLACAFEKLGRTKLDVALVNCAVALTLDKDVVGTAVIALNGLGAAPIVASDAAAFLEGRAASVEVFEEAGRIVSDGVSPRTDHRASGGYRKKVAGVVATRALVRAAGLYRE